MSPSPFETLLPEGWPRPPGYSNGMVAEGRQVFIAGQIGWDAQGRFASASLAGQVRQSLENILAILAVAMNAAEARTQTIGR